MNGAVSAKLNTLDRVTVVVADPFQPLTEVNVPTAYIVPPQSASWRICSVLPVGASVGVPATGIGDTGPVWASAGAPGSAARQRQHALAVAPAASSPRTTRRSRR